MRLCAFALKTPSVVISSPIICGKVRNDDFMIDLDAYLDKFSERGQRILASALEESRQRSQNFISPEHILYVLIIKEPKLFESAMKQVSLNPKEVRLAVEKRLENSPVHSGQGFRLAPDTTEICKFSMDRARSQGRRVIEPEDIISVFTTVKKDLFDDILQNPESPIEVFKRNRINPNFLQNPQPPKSQEQIEFEAKKKEIWQRFHEEQKKFLSNISWEEVIKSNKLLSNLHSFIGGGGGSGSGGGTTFGDKIRYNQHSSSSFYYQLDDVDNFNLGAIISSLKIDVKNCLNQNQLKITNTQSFASGFNFEYEKENLTGKITFSGEITQNYFQLSVNRDETSIRKK